MQVTWKYDGLSAWSFKMLSTFSFQQFQARNWWAGFSCLSQDRAAVWRRHFFSIQGNGEYFTHWAGVDLKLQKRVLGSGSHFTVIQEDYYQMSIMWFFW